MLHGHEIQTLIKKDVYINLLDTKNYWSHFGIPYTFHNSITSAHYVPTRKREK